MPKNSSNSQTEKEQFLAELAELEEDAGCALALDKKTEKLLDKLTEEEPED